MKEMRASAWCLQISCQGMMILHLIQIEGFQMEMRLEIWPLQMERKAAQVWSHQMVREGMRLVACFPLTSC